MTAPQHPRHGHHRRRQFHHHHRHQQQDLRANPPPSQPHLVASYSKLAKAVVPDDVDVFSSAQHVFALSIQHQERSEAPEAGEVELPFGKLATLGGGRAEMCQRLEVALNCEVRTSSALSWRVLLLSRSCSWCWRVPARFSQPNRPSPIRSSATTVSSIRWSCRTAAWSPARLQ